MSRGRNIDELLQPIDEKPLQAFFGQGLRALDLHQKTLRLADVGSPTAIEAANEYLKAAQIAIE